MPSRDLFLWSCCKNSFCVYWEVFSNCTSHGFNWLLETCWKMEKYLEQMRPEQIATFSCRGRRWKAMQVGWSPMSLDQSLLKDLVTHWPGSKGILMVPDLLKLLMLTYSQPWTVTLIFLRVTSPLQFGFWTPCLSHTFGFLPHLTNCCWDSLFLHSVLD